MKFISRLMGLTVFSICLLAAAPVKAADDGSCGAPVGTTQGLIKGAQEADFAACAWKGVPYAAPPVGELRWRSPAPPAKHEGVFEAMEAGAVCPQPESVTAGGDIEKMSEDCLTLNIWRPAKSGSFPVMFWIHGGGYRSGSGGFDIYDGARLAGERDVVIVTINYRLGPLGFLALPELTAEDSNSSSGNYALLDMVRALQWVHDNIGSFGGDAGNVTVFGQSAGGVSAAILLVSPLTEGLMHKAIIESGPADQAESMEGGYERGRAWAAELGCAGANLVDCLRDKPVKDVTAPGGNLILTGGMTYVPHLDGYVFDQDAVTKMQRGEYKKIPVMIGSTRDEIKLYTITIPATSLISRFAMDRIMRKLTGPAYDSLMELYSYDEFKRPINLFHQVATDMAIASRAYLVSEAVSPEVPVYYYRFDWDEVRFPDKMGAFHSLEVPFVFGALDLDFTLAKMVANKKVIQKAMPLVKDIMSYWTNFAKTGDPNGAGLVEWPAYRTETKLRMHLDIPSTVQPVPAKDIERFEFMSQWTMMGMTIEPKSQ